MFIFDSTNFKKLGQKVEKIKSFLEDLKKRKILLRFSEL